MAYDKNFKALVVSEIKDKGGSTSKVAEKFGVPLKTVEKWVTAFNKDNSVFSDGYISLAQENAILKRRIKELEEEKNILKKTILLVSKKD